MIPRQTVFSEPRRAMDTDIWVCVRGCAGNRNRDVEINFSAGDDHENARKRSIDGPQMLAEPTGKKEEGKLERRRETLDEEA